jgi:hypothetical protein
MALQLVGANSERLHRAIHRLVREPSGLADAFAEPDDARKRIDDAKAATRWARNEQPAIVRAEIEGSINGFVSANEIIGLGHREAPLSCGKLRLTPVRQGFSAVMCDARLRVKIAMAAAQRLPLGRCRYFVAGVAGMDRPLDVTVTRSVRT